MSDVEQQLRNFGRDPGIEPRPVAELERRARHRRRRRLTVGAALGVAGLVAIVVGVLAVVPSSGAAPPEMVGSPDDGASPAQRPSASPDATAGSSTGLFVPATSSAGGDTVAPVVLPDGSTATLRYPQDVRVVERGVSVTATIRMADDLLPFTTERLLLARHGPVEEVVAAVVATSPDAPQSEPFTGERLATVAANLGGGENEDGFLVLEPGDALTIDSAMLAVGAPAPSHGALADGYHIPRDGALTVEAANCTPQGEGSTEPQVYDGTVSASWCTQGLRLFTRAPEDDRQTLSRWMKTITTDDVRLSGWIVDRSWVTEAQMQAETGASPERLRVAGAFYRPGATVDPEADPVGDTVVRYKPVDVSADAPTAQAIAEAFAALQGPPPPGLDHALRNATAGPGPADRGRPRDDRLPPRPRTTDQRRIPRRDRDPHPGRRTGPPLLPTIPDPVHPHRRRRRLRRAAGPYLFHESDACPIELP